MVRKDITRYWALTVITAIHDHNGKLLGYTKLIRDISERKQREDALRASEAARYEEREQLHQVLSSIPDGIISLNSEGRVVLMNPKAEEMTGCRQNESCGLPIEEVFILWSPLQDKNQLEAFSQCLAEGRQTYYQKAIIWYLAGENAKKYAVQLHQYVIVTILLLAPSWYSKMSPCTP